MTNTGYGDDRPAGGGDLDLCAQEPIRIPGSIQPHGAVLVVDPESGRLLQASANAGTFLGGDATAWAARLGATEGLRALDGHRTVAAGQRTLQLAAHRTHQGLILELEEGEAGRDALYPELRRFLDRLEPLDSIAAIMAATVREVRMLTGFDRVLAYRFDADGHGTVLAEDGSGVLPSCLDLRFPASDIPAQARALYRVHRLRIIPDADYLPVPIEPVRSPVDGEPLDLGGCALRSVSPVHLEYMRNMGTRASMSVSLVVDGRLWGLVSCHHAGPRRVDPRVRAAAEFVGRIVSQQIGALERTARSTRRIELKRVESALLVPLARVRTLADGLIAHPEAWMALTGAEGAAILSDGVVASVGTVPPHEAIRALATWLRAAGRRDPVFATACLAAEMPGADAFAATGSGVISVAISGIHDDAIFWFRPEVVRTVRWAGDRRKAEPGRDGRIHPRRSFALWKEQVRGCAVPWSEAEIDSARDFRTAIVDVVLRRAEERAIFTEELERSNRELESFSYSVSHDLRAPFRHIAGYAELLRQRATGLDETSRHYLATIVDAALAAGRLVDDLLRFSHLGRTSLAMGWIDMDKLVAEVRRAVDREHPGRTIEWRIAPLPVAWGDAGLIRQVLLNLMENAAKYTRGREPAVIAIDGRAGPTETEYRVSDNGVGFDMAYVGKLFGVFQRLHRAEEFEGTGIGLALAKRIVDRHGGAIAAEGTLGRGAAFRFALPRHGKEGVLGGP
ncbi:ATP-binding protein [Stella sp.]|uniref:ATP-binding protein n=1 Tax=Stella sp. TaxID=2912054 RepID=UPI0035B274A4